MLKIALFFFTCIIIPLLVGCSSTKQVVVKSNQSNGYLIEILKDSVWEYHQSSYYRILKNGNLVVDTTFIVQSGDPSNIQIKTVDNFFYGVEKERSRVVLFIHRFRDDASWPSSRKWADELLSALRIATKNIDLQLSTRVSN
jgi:hypothetical protein